MIRFGRTMITHARLIVGLVALAILVIPAAASAADLNATPATLKTVYADAAGGDTILLAAGSYGSFAGGSKSSIVTLKAAPGASVSLTPTFSPATNLRLDGLTVPGGTIRDSRNIQVVNSTVTGIIVVFATVRDAGILFDHNVLPNVNLNTSGFEGRLWINAFNAPNQPSGVTITNNTFDGGSADGVQLGGQANDVLIQGNVFRHLHTSACSTCSDGYNHTDPIQIVGAQRTKIIGNYFQDVSTTVMGPEGGDADLLIKDNVMVDVDQYCADLGYKPRLQFVHNTCVNAPLRLTDNHSGSTTPTTAAVLRDNVFGAGLIIGQVGSIAQEDYNLYGSGTGSGSHDLRGTPQYVAADIAGPTSGYALKSTSLGVNVASDATNMGAGVSSGGSPPPPPSDTTAPDTTITSGPSNPTTSTSASFAFTSSEPVSTFECKLDAGAYASCSSPKGYSALSTGSHTFTVRAIDAAGNMDASVASRTWTVTADTPPPTDHQPVAAYVYSPTAPAVGQAVTFDASSATCEDAPCTYTWVDDGPDGPDGGQWPLGNGRILTFTFSGTGTKNVRLAVTDADGDTASTVKAIIVAASPPADTTAPNMLLGNSSVQSSADAEVSGRADAFRSIASGSGRAVSMSLYVNTGNTATSLVVGIYSDANGHPGTLLNKGTRSSLISAAWNKVTVPATALASGQAYWIAMMGTGGTLRFRDGVGTCRSEYTNSTSLTTLPTTWLTSPTWAACPLSGYATT